MRTAKRQITGNGKPVICVPIIEKQTDAILAEVRKLAEKQVPMIEWRMDWYEQAADIEAVRAVLTQMQPNLDNTILLATFRTVNQGGEQQTAPEQLIKIYQMIAENGLADMLDIEYYEWPNAEQVIRQLQQTGVQIVSSHHDFERTPSNETMEQILISMAEAGADIVKLAVMPQDKADVLRLLAVTSAFKAGHDMPVVTMSMGKVGIISRICGEIFGSCITFGAREYTSAPGQIPMEKLDTILTCLHESYEMIDG